MSNLRVLIDDEWVDPDTTLIDWSKHPPVVQLLADGTAWLNGVNVTTQWNRFGAPLPPSDTTR